MINKVFMVDVRDRYCEVGVFTPTETRDGALVLRRVMSMGSLWRFNSGERITFPDPVAIPAQNYQARSSAGFTKTTGTLLFERNVAAVIESGGKTLIRAFTLHFLPAGTELYVPERQPVQFNENVTAAALDTFQFKADMNISGRFYIAEGQSNTFRYAEMFWKRPEEESLPEFLPEHKPDLADLIVKELPEGKLWAEHAAEDLTALEVLSE